MKKGFLLILMIGCVVCKLLASPVISIATCNTQLVLKVKDNGRLYQAYFGQKLSERVDMGSLDMPLVNQTSPMTKGDEAYPVMGTEDYFEPAMEIRHADGNPTSVFKYVSHETHAIDGGTETVIRLHDEVYPVNLTLHYAAFPETDIIKAWSEISHREKGSVRLGRYASAMLYFQSPTYWLTEFSSDWAKEMQMSTTRLNYGRKVLDTRLGSRAAMLTQPFFELGFGGQAREDEGMVLMGTMAWTGNFRFTFEVDQNNQLRVIGGINPDASAYTLSSGKTFRTPEFIFTLSDKGIGEGSRRFQRWAMDRQLYKGNDDRLTLLNNWENTYFDFDEQKLSALFGEAKDLGVDMFLLDDGWFGNKYPRKDDHAGLGDWQVTKTKLPHGLPFLVKAAEEKGVAFGLWVEPEMVNPKSELAERHPDWIIQLPKRETYYFRNQLVLDLANPKVQDFVYGVIDGIMRENPHLKFLKWDCNSPITNIYSPYEKTSQGNLYVDYVRGFYNVLGRIQTAYPDLRMMLCSGGGARCDYEALKYFTEFWCSDNTDPVERLYIQWGFSQFMPAKAMCAHVTNWNSRASVKFRVDVAFPCKLGFDIDLKSMSKENLAYCQQALREYNRLKPVIYSPMLYRLFSPYDGNHCVLQRMSDDGAKGLLFSYDIHPRYNETMTPVRLKALDPNASYTVREISLMPGKKSQYQFSGKTYVGDYLMKVGLPLLTMQDMASHIIEITKN